MTNDQMAFEIFKILIQKLKPFNIPPDETKILGKSYAYDAYRLCEGFLSNREEEEYRMLKKLEKQSEERND